MTIAGSPFGTTTRTIRTLLLLAFLSILANGAHAATLTGRVVGVTDGDTITVLDAAHQQHKVRLAGIDTPEKSQAFGQRAKQHLSRLVFDRTVAIEGSKRDRDGRLIGKVLVSSTDANLQQIRAGLAWHYKQYANEQSPTDRALYADAEEEARSRHIGLWADASPQPPWEYRHARKTVGSGADTAIGSECPCGHGSLCTGSKGGTYCLSPSGKKRYQ